MAIFPQLRDLPQSTVISPVAGGKLVDFLVVGNS